MLGVRHQAEDVARFVCDCGDLTDRAVRVLLVAQDDLLVRLEACEQLAVREVAALAVLDGNRHPLPGLAAAREGRGGVLDDQTHVAADKRKGRVRPQRPGKEARLAENLKTVADPEH